MIRNGIDISTDQHAQVCIIGSGPAGITAAYELSQAGFDVIVLEGGRQAPENNNTYYKLSWDDKVFLYNGVADGLFKISEPNFLIRPNNNEPYSPRERERVIGGTSTHWGGQSRPLDPITFEKRKGFPGWPISRTDLDPYYAKASVFNHLHGDYGTSGTNFTAEYWVSQIESQGSSASIPEMNGFNVEMYQFMGSQWLNSATRSFDINIYNPCIDVIINATVLNIVEQSGSIQYLNVASIKGESGETPQKATEFKVTADVYILACGAVANARQLLLSEVGNQKMVGHYFMCHPLSATSIIQTTENYLTNDELNLMNGVGWSDPTHNINGFTGRFTADADTAQKNEIGRSWFWANRQFNSNQMYFEMAPNYDSVITLNDSTDPVFKQKQTHIDWQFTDLDQKTYEMNCELFSASSSKFSKIINWPSWKDLLNQWTVNGHHIGTTKMTASTDPDNGVVDQNLKIHTVDNMYVAGSSVFPSTGVSNPTMTIMALSIRLAEYLKTQISA